MEKELIKMLKLLTSEFKLAKSEIRINRNKDVQKMGDKLKAGECSQEEYNFLVNLYNKVTEYDENIIKKADELLLKATTI